ncbi:hypothetical protein [Sporolactobacillus terrae]|uniref:hypothetical protein n=1 Tax=Sporolactobacillus terrae TaxID=269673 RepID=UPI00048C374A|nr:hypothetical protein [Sporolactobacillus terrae]
MNTVNMSRTTISTNVQYSINDRLIKDQPFSYHSVLQSKLDEVRERIGYGFMKIKGCLLESTLKAGINQEEWDHLMKETLLVQKWFDNKGFQKLKDLEKNIHNKIIGSNDFELLNSVFDNQKAIYLNLFTSDRNFERDQVETMLSYLAELPSYLEFDLNLDELPNRSEIRRTIKVNIKQEIQSDIKYKLAG